MHFPTWLPPDGKEIVYRLEIAGEPRDLRDRAPTARASDGAVDDACQQRVRLSVDRRLARRLAGDVHPLVKRRARCRCDRLVAEGVCTRRQDRQGDAVPDSRRDRSTRGRLLTGRDARGLRPDLSRRGPSSSSSPTPMGPATSGPSVPGSRVHPTAAKSPASWAFTPDGTALIVRYGDDAKGTTHLMPLDGSPPTDLGSGGFEFVDIQRLAP